MNDQIAGAAIDVIKESIDKGGRFPAGLPFHTNPGGEQSHAANAQALRATASLIRKYAYDHPVGMIASILERSVAYFVESKADAPVAELLHAWRRQGSSNAAPCSPWITAVAVQALDAIERTIDKVINFNVAGLLKSRTPGKLPDGLIPIDLGLSLLRSRLPGNGNPTCLRVLTERMRCHLRGQVALNRAEAIGLRTCKFASSLILYGPPGTGKTSLAEDLASSSGAILVEVTPSPFLVRGPDGVEEEAEAIMAALCMLRHAVVLFDEFDPLLKKRAGDVSMRSDADSVSMFSFVTANMLPRLKHLHDIAASHPICYVLATNFVRSLDDAAVRQGRFDARMGVYAPDVLSRTWWLLDRIRRSGAAQRKWTEDDWKVLRDVIRHTEGQSVAVMCQQLQKVVDEWLQRLQDVPGVDGVAAPGEEDIGPLAEAKRRLESGIADVASRIPAGYGGAIQDIGTPQSEDVLQEGFEAEWVVALKRLRLFQHDAKRKRTESWQQALERIVARREKWWGAQKDLRLRSPLPLKDAVPRQDADKSRDEKSV